MNTKNIKAESKPTIHEIKIIEPYYTIVQARWKTFEVRKDDRDYRTGDYLKMRLWDEEKQDFDISQPPIIGRIAYKLDGGQFGIEKGYCVLQMDYDSIMSKPLVVTTKY